MDDADNEATIEEELALAAAEGRDVEVGARDAPLPHTQRAVCWAAQNSALWRVGAAVVTKRVGGTGGGGGGWVGGGGS